MSKRSLVGLSVVALVVSCGVPCSVVIGGGSDCGISRGESSFAPFSCSLQLVQVPQSAAMTSPK